MSSKYEVFTALDLFYQQNMVECNDTIWLKVWTYNTVQKMKQSVMENFIIVQL